MWIVATFSLQPHTTSAQHPPTVPLQQHHATSITGEPLRHLAYTTLALATAKASFASCRLYALHSLPSRKTGVASALKQINFCRTGFDPFRFFSLRTLLKYFAGGHMWEAVLSLDDVHCYILVCRVQFE